MKNSIFTSCLVLIFCHFAMAQDLPSPATSGGYSFGIKGGPSICTQTWNNFQRSALISYHGDIFIESLGPWTDKKGTGVERRSSFGAQLGYHKKGSSFRNVFWVGNGGNQRPPANEFHNISLCAYGKGAMKAGGNNLAYYGMGLRVDYTITYNLLGVDPTGVNRFNYGVWLGGGYEIALKNSPWALFVEANVSPDLSKQVFIPPGLVTQYTDENGNPILSTEQKVYNLVFELSIGVKLNN